MKKNKQYKGWRRLAAILQAAVILGLPFIRINGESALRFDVPSLRLHFFGVSLWMEEFFLVLMAIVFFTLLLFLVTLLFGRIWCGWLCPQTVLLDFTAFVHRAGLRGASQKLLSYLPTLGLAALVGVSLIWYFVSPYEFIPRLAAGSLGTLLWGFWIVLTIIIFLDLAFLRHRFCATVCPYSMMQSTLYDKHTMVIAFDEDRKADCRDCKACVTCCPVDIDIRDGLNRACITCAECVDTCGSIMDVRGLKSLIGYRFGLKGEGFSLFRASPLILFAVTALFLVLTLHLSASRIALAVTVLPNRDFPPRISRTGEVVNGYLLSVRNRGRDPVSFILEARSPGREVTLKPAGPRSIDGGSAERLPIYIAIKDPEGAKTVTISLRSKEPETQITSTATIQEPGKR